MKKLLENQQFPISCVHGIFNIQIKALYTPFEGEKAGILLYKKSVGKYVENLEGQGLVCYNNRVV